MKETVEIIGAGGREVIEAKDLEKRLSRGAVLANPPIKKKVTPGYKPLSKPAKKREAKKKGGK